MHVKHMRKTCRS